ncbi:hypothetical protein [Ferruginibacter sp.]|nr:hypothetical protein [Ferruginibacter sp.]
MNLKILAIFILFNCVEKSYGQRMYVVPNFEIQYSGISYVKKREKNKSDFTPSKPKINGTWGVDIYYRSKKTIYRFSIQREILGEAFGIKNKFFNLEKDLGIIGHQTSSGVEHYVMSCNLGNGDTRFRNFIFKNKVKFTYAIGIGIGFNRQKSFYQEQYYYRTGGRADAYSI